MARAAATEPAPFLARAAQVAGPAAVGVAAACAAIAMSGLSTKRSAVLIVAFLIPLVAIVTRRARLVFLFCWVASLTYNRNYFLDALLGNNLSYGFYWSPADVFLIALYAIWGFEIAVEKRPLAPLGAGTLRWFLPFAIGCLVSIAGAERMDWGLYEYTRVVRMGLILVYVRYNVRRDEWLACVLAFALAIAVQASMGIPYVATGTRLGLANLLGTENQLSALKDALQGGLAGQRRAEGTIGHPNTLALYLLLVGPIFVALTAGLRGRRWQVASAAMAILSLATVAVTLSRTSWLISLAQAGLVVIGLIGMRMLDLRRALGIAILSAAIASVAIIPFTDEIAKRFENFGEMVDFRKEHAEIAVEIWKDAPFFGIGLGQYSERLSRYPLFEIKMYNLFAEYVRLGLEIRVTAWVHNMYLLMLAETGLFGFAGYLIFATGALVLGVRAANACTAFWRAAGLGLLVGVVGVHLHGLQESGLWVDPITYSFTLVVGLLALVPALARADAERGARSET